MLHIPLLWLELPADHVVYSLLSPFLFPVLSLCDFVSVLVYRSVPTHVPQTVTVHTAVARVPSPTLVYSTVPPYRYMSRMMNAAADLQCDTNMIY